MLIGSPAVASTLASKKRIVETFGPFVANTHTETNVTGTTMTRAYHQAQHIIKKHVNAGEDDVIIHTEFGMTAAVNKFQRILGLRVPEQLAPYAPIDMHPQDPLEKLDAIFFSPHKFLGGPGSSGVLIFDSKLYQNEIPDHPGGGTVYWTNSWGHYKSVSNIEAREDGGTPGFLQAIKGALAVRLKETMSCAKIARREEHLVRIIFQELPKIPRLHILAGALEERLGVISFYIDGLHYTLVVKLLNDRFGIQVRGGCSCAGTYGHYLLHVGPETSKRITDKIDAGDLSEKPGWVRMSLHPTMTDAEIYYIVEALSEIVKNHSRWEGEYTYSLSSNEFINVREKQPGEG